MEWKSLSILAFICQLTVTVHKGSVGGTSSSYIEEKTTRRASVVMCHPDQTFFCVNRTHYSPCIHLDLLDLLNPSSTMSLEKEFYCGAERCCQVGADSPCTYRCQRNSLDFGNPRIPWNFSRLRKKKKKRNKKVPLTSEEVDRLNRIVSVKTFIIRQKDLEEWDDYDLDNEDNGFRWRPSYRTFCPLKKSSSNDVVTETCGSSLEPSSTERITEIATTTLKPSATTTKSTATTLLKTTTTTTTTTTKSATKTTTEKSTTRTISMSTAKTTAKITVPNRTTQHITEPIRSTESTRTTKRISTKRTTTRKPSTQRPKRTTPAKTSKPKTTKPNEIPPLPCNHSTLNKTAFVPGSCKAYRICIKKNGRYKWRVKLCKGSDLYDSGLSKCVKAGKANCDIDNQDF